MLLPQRKEREYRFKLALRMGFPIFLLVFLLITTTIVSTQEHLTTTFYSVSLILFTFTIYFILFLINNGFSIRITDFVTKTFTREYFSKYAQTELTKNENYSLILISVKNIHDINTNYGLKNGDKVLRYVAKWIANYIESQGLYNFPLGHIKGGDFVLGLKGTKSDFNTMLDIMSIKSENLKLDDIEIILSGAISDNTYSNNFEHLVENLYSTQILKVSKKDIKEEINPSELESIVVQAIKDRSILVKTQDVFFEDKPYIKECSIKLLGLDDKIIHQKQFIKVINRLGFEVDYDLLVLERVVTQTIRGSDEIYAIVISPRSLRNNHFIAKAKELLRSFPEARYRLMFMLIESEYFSQIARYNSIINSFRDMGVLIAVDRLGAFHASFLYLKELDIDAIRFDSVYTKNEKYSDVLDGLAYIARKKGIKTWLKLIEDEETLKRAKKLNIDLVQGRFLAELQTQKKDNR